MARRKPEATLKEGRNRLGNSRHGMEWVFSSLSFLPPTQRKKVGRELLLVLGIGNVSAWDVRRKDEWMPESKICALPAKEFGGGLETLLETLI